MSQNRHTYIGALLMVFAMFCFGMGNAIVKSAANLGINQIIFMRGGIGLLLVFLVLPWMGGLSILKSEQLPLQILRGAIGYGGLFFLFLSFHLLPLADATVLSFGTVLIITALSGPLLKEKVSTPQWIAVLIGLIGVVIVANPTGKIAVEDAGVSLLGCLGEGGVLLLSKILGRTDKPLTCTFYHTLLTFLIAAFFIPFAWISPTFEQIISLGGVALFGLMGQISIVKAYSLASPVVVSPMIYSLVVWGGVLGYLIWGEVPAFNVWLGAPVIIGSGLYIVFHETRSTRKKI